MGIIEVIAALEIITVNMLTLDKCCKRKASGYKILTIIGLYTVAVIWLGYVFVSRLPFYGNGNGAFVLFGFFYLLPIRFLYDEKISTLFTIMCMAWVYTLGVFTLSVQICKLFGPSAIRNNTIFVETLLFLTTIVPFHKIIVKRYTYIVNASQNENKNWSFYLTAISTLQFFTIFLVNFIFSLEKGSIFKIFVILFLIMTIFTSYCIFNRMLHSEQQAETLNVIAHRDKLTGLYNRLSLYNDLGRLVDRGKSFSIVFMDLDSFKQINDTYGHIMGDRYLQHFAAVITNIMQDSGRCYRFGGDEFLIISETAIDSRLLDQLRECTSWEDGAPCEFKSVSVGTQLYSPPHPSIDEIINQVDQLMYASKKKKHHLE